MLNILDLGVCILTVITQILRVLRLSTDRLTHVAIENVTESIYVIFTENTGFATLLLSVTRCLSVINPMSRIRGLRVAVSACIFIVYTTSREIIFYLIWIFARTTYSSQVHATIIASEIGLLVIFVIVANLISVSTLLRSGNVAEQSREAGFQATLTIFILSALFCVFNATYCISFVIHVYSNKPINDNVALWFGAFYAVPINSALNPIIYFWRKKEMKEYLMNLMKATFTFCYKQPRNRQN